MQEREVTAEQYEHALGCVGKKVSVLYKRKTCEVNIGPYDTVILKLLKSNLTLQFVTGVYAMLTYLAVSEFIKKASKEAYGKDIKIFFFYW